MSVSLVSWTPLPRPSPRCLWPPKASALFCSHYSVPLFYAVVHALLAFLHRIMDGTAGSELSVTAALRCSQQQITCLGLPSFDLPIWIAKTLWLTSTPAPKPGEGRSPLSASVSFTILDTRDDTGMAGISQSLRLR